MLKSPTKRIGWKGWEIIVKILFNAIMNRVLLASPVVFYLLAGEGMKGCSILQLGMTIFFTAFSLANLLESITTNNTAELRMPLKYSRVPVIFP